MRSQIRNVDFVCKMCGELLFAWNVNTNLEIDIVDPVTVECEHCGYDNDIYDIMDGEL